MDEILNLTESRSEGFPSYSFIFLNLFDLLECPVMLMTLILVIRFRQQNFSDKDTDIIKFVRRFQNFIGGIST